MKKLTLDVNALQVDSFATLRDEAARQGTVRAASASEEGESLCCPTQTDQASCFGTCQGTCQNSCGCSGYWTCVMTCVACPTHSGSCPRQETCGETCWC